MYNIKFIRENLEFQASPGMNLLEAERKAGLMPDAPCGGQGKCGKCRVKIDGKVVLACKTVVDRDMEVDTLKGDSGYEILTEGFKRPILFDPDLKQQKVFLTTSSRCCATSQSVQTQHNTDRRTADRQGQRDTDQCRHQNSHKKRLHLRSCFYQITKGSHKR